jgi:hypothetical protein
MQCSEVPVGSAAWRSTYARCVGISDCFASARSAPGETRSRMLNRASSRCHGTELILTLLQIGMRCRLANALRDFLCAGDIGEGCAHSPPAFASLSIDEQRGVQSDVVPFFSSIGMDQSISSDHLSTWVAQDREPAIDNFLPDQTGVLAIIDTDCDKPRIQGIEVFFVPRELAQLTRAVRSPIAPVKNKQHAPAA